MKIDLENNKKISVELEKEGETVDIIVGGRINRVVAYKQSGFLPNKKEKILYGRLEGL